MTVIAVVGLIMVRPSLSPFFFVRCLLQRNFYFAGHIEYMSAPGALIDPGHLGDGSHADVNPLRLSCELMLHNCHSHLIANSPFAKLQVPPGVRLLVSLRVRETRRGAYPRSVPPLL